MPTIEYRVKPVTRYIVTKHVSEPNGASSSQVGEYPNGAQADLVADALVALDEKNGFTATRSRFGLMLGEIISGSRVEPQPDE